ncbi:hypothetical protein [Streptomyces sp. Da 82-17]|uniref:hypothetical protein n=1 Tax=Streptomyces sp. Da 82-17 TaxID=3377116 RepID=UPI0038D38EC1
MRTSRPGTARLRTARLLLWAGSGALALGAVLCVLGWYGVSGERFAERQIPYLASCTAPGAALIVAGAILLVGAGNDRSGERVRELYELLVAADPGTPAAASSGPRSDELVQVPGGTLYHRADCPLVVGRPEAVRAGPGPGLAPCPICEPASHGPEGHSPDEADPEP